MQLIDLKLIVRLVLLCPVAWLVPARYWHGIWKLPYRWGLIVKDELPDVGERLRVLPATRRHFNLSSNYHYDSEHYEEHLQFLRMSLPVGRFPRMVVQGLENLDREIVNNRGALLLVPNFIGSRLIQKKALYDAGYKVNHLSRSTHGFAQTPFAIRHMNTRWAALENTFLESRVMIDDGMQKAMRQIRALLAEKKIVSITDNVDSTMSLVRRPFLEGTRLFPVGPARIAIKSGVPLLPVMTHRLSSDSYEITIEKPVYVPAEGAVEVDTVIDRYSDVLREHIIRAPLLWVDWGKTQYHPEATKEHATIREV